VKRTPSEGKEEGAEASPKATPFWSVGMYACAFAAVLVVVKFFFIPEEAGWAKPMLAAIGLAFVVMLIERIREKR
jgi:hypothetical protein